MIFGQKFEKTTREAFLSSETLDRARTMACLAGGMKGFALQMPCLPGQTFVPAVKILVRAVKTLVPAVKTLVGAVNILVGAVKILVGAVKTLVPEVQTKGFSSIKPCFSVIYRDS